MTDSITQAQPSSFWRALPNCITLFRLLLSPVSAVLIIQQRLGAALIVFVLVALSDWLDGEIARRFNARTKLGAYLDPIADKFFIIATYGALALAAMLPLWLSALIIGRDVLMMLLGLSTWIAYRKIWVYDTVAISRIATTGQMTLAALVIAAHYYDFASLMGSEAARQWTLLLDGAFWLILLLTLIAGFVYARRWLLFVIGRADPYAASDDAA